MEHIKTVKFHKTGDASVLEFVDEPVRQLQPHEISIRVEAIGLNRAEVMYREGAYLETPTLPSRLGYEAAGTVIALGSDISDLKIGDKVSTIPAFSMGEYGVYSEVATVPRAAVARYPESLSPREAASIWMQYITAYGALVDIGDLCKAQYALITAASSSVGVAAIQIANALGAVSIATTRGPEKAAALKSLGAAHVIVTDEEAPADRVADISGGAGANVIFDPIGGPGLETLAQCAAMGATIVEYGALDPRPTPFPLFAALAKGLSVRGYTLFELTQNPARLEKAVDFIDRELRTGALKPVLDKDFAFADIQNAHRYMESNQQLGKITVSL